MSAHSVARHLRVSVETYDADIRRFVPRHDELLRAGVELLASLAPPAPVMLDLGAGPERSAPRSAAGERGGR